MAFTLSALASAFILTVLLPDSFLGLEHRNPGRNFDPHGFKPVQASVQARISMLFGCPGLDSGDANITCTNEKLESKHGPGMDCSEKVPVKTKAVFLNCPIGYKLAEDYTVLTCKFPGKWDKEMFTCDEVPTEPPTTTTTTKKPTTTTKKILATKRNKTTIATTKPPTNTTTNSTLTTLIATNTTANNLTTLPTTISNIYVTPAVNATTISSASSSSSVLTPLATVPTMLPNVSTAATSAIPTEITTTPTTSAIGAIPPSVAPMITTMSTPTIPVPTTTTPPTITPSIPTPTTTTPPITSLTPITPTPTTSTPTTSTPTMPTPTTTMPPASTPTTIPPLYINVPNIGVIKKSPWVLGLSDAIQDCKNNGASLLIVDTDFKKAFVKTFATEQVYLWGAEPDFMWVGVSLSSSGVWVNSQGVNMANNTGFQWIDDHPIANTQCVVYRNSKSAHQAVGLGSTRCTDLILYKQAYICIRP